MGLVAEDLALDVGEQDGWVPSRETLFDSRRFSGCAAARLPGPGSTRPDYSRNSQETKPLEQRDGLVPRLLKDPAVEGDLRQFTRDDLAGAVSVVAGHETSDARKRIPGGYPE